MILSIVIPVYNVEVYLGRCLNSVLEQDLGPNEYEILVIDDGSTDTSGLICDEFANQYENIHVFHQENQGLSAARNRGIQEAKGEYIQFVDSDDYLMPNVLGRIIRQADENQLDVLRFNYQNVNQEGNPIQLDKTPKLYVDYSPEVCDGVTFLNERLGYACYAVQFLIRAELLKPENQWFKPGIFYEDAEWTPRILLNAGRLASTDRIVYNYVYRSESITKDTNIDKRRKSLEDRLFIIDSYILQTRSSPNNHWFRGMIAYIVISIINDVSRFFFKERRQYLRTLKAKGVFPLISYNSTATARKKALLINFSPEVACIVLHHKNAL